MIGWLSHLPGMACTNPRFPHIGFGSVALCGFGSCQVSKASEWWTRRCMSLTTAKPAAAKPNATKPAAAEPDMAKPDATQPAAAKPRHQPQPNPKQSTSMAKQQLTDPEDAKPEAAKTNTAKPKAAKPEATEGLPWLAWHKGGHWVVRMVEIPLLPK